MVEVNKKSVDVLELERAFAVLIGGQVVESAVEVSKESKQELPMVEVETVLPVNGMHVHKRLKISFIVCSDCEKLLGVICPDKGLAVDLQGSIP